MATRVGNRITLSPRELPGEWYDPRPDLPFELPPMMSPSGYPVTATELGPLFSGAAIDQELGRLRRHRIPKPVRDAYAHWRPTPMFRAERLERALDTPAKLFYKFEGGSPCGSYESNTAIPQAFFVRAGGFRRIITGGAGGIWVAAIGYAARFFDVACRVYSVRSPDAGGVGQAAARLWDIDLVPSPSEA
ncbi:MAG: TrpB-like pyridoxal-phosphate dependent enzyme, partial [Gemmatimonadetes bacterium]|nr:TrpB-like pyridoxal-phosphate dependent enzyme [Gemmatimonadota bacterium]